MGNVGREIDTSDVIQRVLADTGLSIAELSFHAGKHPATVERWLNGKTKPNERTVAQALRAINVDPADYGVREPSTMIRPAMPGTAPPATGADPPSTLEMLARIEAKLDEVLRLLHDGE